MLPEKQKKYFNVPENYLKRKYSETPDSSAYRTEFMRDRDRVLYATAFRRLAGKTQIYTVGTDDHKRNRMTHTLEVAQISRTVASALGLNADLAEAIALAHDFGHTPFGHAGEEMLHEIMCPDSEYVKLSPFYQKNHKSLKKRFNIEAIKKSDYFEQAFGFKHNIQSVRVASVLEDSYRNNKNENIGLNLTNYTLFGIVEHSKWYYQNHDFKPDYLKRFDDEIKLKDLDTYAWSLEAYIVKTADDFS